MSPAAIKMESTDSRNRRARILNAAREMLIDGGPDAVVMRDLAIAADVSVPTLYNMFGSKNGILAASMQELHFDAIDRIRGDGKAQGFDHILALLEGLRREMAAIPVFARATFQLYVTWVEESDHRRFTNLEFAQGYLGCLREMRDAGELDTRLDIEVLADVINNVVMHTASDWAFGRLDLDGFVASAGRAIAYLLMGITSGTTKQKVETYLGLEA
ncbi:MAG: TetR/AcrR family transcriptional regulator [Alphaproteobacteria bacterium]